MNMEDYQILDNYTTLFKIPVSLFSLSCIRTGIWRLILLRFSALNFLAPLILQISAITSWEGPCDPQSR